jgi:hypothetical protein
VRKSGRTPLDFRRLRSTTPRADPAAAAGKYQHANSAQGDRAHKEACWHRHATSPECGRHKAGKDVKNSCNRGRRLHGRQYLFLHNRTTAKQRGTALLRLNKVGLLQCGSRWWRSDVVDHSLPNCDVRLMSVIPSTATNKRTSRKRREVPGTTFCTAGKRRAFSPSGRREVGHRSPIRGVLSCPTLQRAWP